MTTAINEYYLQTVFDIETAIGIVWLPSVRDRFRYMWE